MKTNFKNRLFQCLLALFSLISLSQAAADAPNPPQNLEATAISNHKIRLNWKDMSNNELGFKIEMRREDSNWVNVGTTPRNIERFTMSGLESDTRYHFRVSAFNASGISAPSNVATAKTFPDINFRTPPAPPGNLTAHPISPHKIKLEWNDNSFNEFAFIIEIKKHNNNGWRIAGMVRQNVEMYVQEGLQASTGYDFRVIAINPWGRGASNIASARTPDDSSVHVPRPPSHLRGFAVGHRAIIMKWNDNSNNENGFTVERRRHTPGNIIWVPIANLPANSERYRDTVNIEPNERYSYRVTAYNTAGRSEPSNILTVLTPDRNIFVNSVIHNFNQPLSWMPLAGAENYRIEVAFDEDFESIIYEEEIGNVTNYAIGNTELAENEDYYLRIVGLNSDGEDIFSEAVRIDSPTNIFNTSSEIPEKFSLSQNYPNPFNPVTKIKFAITANGFIKLEVYDLTGRLITTLVKSELQAGSYEFTFDAVNLSSGIYFYRLTSSDFVETKRMILLK